MVRDSSWSAALATMSTDVFPSAELEVIDEVVEEEIPSSRLPNFKILFRRDVVPVANRPAGGVNLIMAKDKLVVSRRISKVRQ